MMALKRCNMYSYCNIYTQICAATTVAASYNAFPLAIFNTSLTKR